MRTPSRLFLAVLLFVGGIAAGRAQAVFVQPPAPPPPPPPPGVQAPQPPAPPPAPAQNIVSGNDIGFRIDAYRRGTPIGVLVIRVDGRWVEPDFGMTLRRLSSQ